MKRGGRGYEEEEEKGDGEECRSGQNQPQGEGQTEKVQTALNGRDATEVVKAQRGLDGAVNLIR